MRFLISIAWTGELSLTTLGSPVLAQSPADQLAGYTAQASPQLQ